MAALSTPLLAIGLFFSLAFWRWIVQPAFISPLAKVPSAHWSAPFSSLWIFHKRCLQKDTFAVHDAHVRLGRILRLAPNEVSVNSLEGVQTIYGRSFEKNNWYANVFSNYGVRPAFAMSSNSEHSRRKRAMGNVYVKSTLFSSPALESISRTIISDRLLPRLRNLARTGEVTEFYDIFAALTIDYVVTYCYGLKAGSNLVSQPELASKFAIAYKTRVKYVSLPQEVPGLTSWMGRRGILPWILPPLAANRSLDWDPEAWLLDMQDQAEEVVQRAEREGKHNDTGDWPTVYAQLRSTLHTEQQTNPPGKGMPDHIRLTIASELDDHVFAGFDTGSMVLTYLAWEISKLENVVWQERLRDEVASLADSSNAKTLDGLPILHAVLMETLRLHAPVSGNQVRVTPSTRAVFNVPGGATVTFPPNTRVHAQAWSLHRNPSVFPDPERWSPARWLDSNEEQLKDMNRWFWVFGSGSRMCTGINLAMIELKGVTASIWRDFTTELVDGAGMAHNGGYLAGPLGSNGRYLMLRVKAVGQTVL
ncbi:Na+/H+ antiporter [Elasticomyces elasticus]|nr:Na+/H+ antiporter [Elasticomyces elasticus]